MDRRVGLGSLLVTIGCSVTNPAYPMEAGSKGMGGSGDGTGGSATTVSATGVGSGASMSETADEADATIDPAESDGAESTGEPDCDCNDAEICTPAGCRGGQVFLNFDGPVMTVGAEDDAQSNTTSIDGYGGPMAPFGGGDEMRDALLEAVRLRFQGLSVWITDMRPTDGDYTMVVLGDNVLEGLEVTQFDCDNDDANSVVFAGISAGDNLTRDEHALVVSHGIGHSFGLAHVAPSNAIMAASIEEPVASRFRDECVELSSAPACDAHTEWCTPMEQNSWAQLEGVFGPL